MTKLTDVKMGGAYLSIGTVAELAKYEIDKLYEYGQICVKQRNFMYAKAALDIWK